MLQGTTSIASAPLSRKPHVGARRSRRLRLQRAHRHPNSVRRPSPNDLCREKCRSVAALTCGFALPNWPLLGLLRITATLRHFSRSTLPQRGPASTASEPLSRRPRVGARRSRRHRLQRAGQHLRGVADYVSRLRVLAIQQRLRGSVTALAAMELRASANRPQTPRRRQMKSAPSGRSGQAITCMPSQTAPCSTLAPRHPMCTSDILDASSTPSSRAPQYSSGRR